MEASAEHISQKLKQLLIFKALGRKYPKVDSRSVRQNEIEMEVSLHRNASKIGRGSDDLRRVK